MQASLPDERAWSAQIGGNALIAEHEQGAWQNHFVDEIMSLDCYRCLDGNYWSYQVGHIMRIFLGFFALMAAQGMALPVGAKALYLDLVPAGENQMSRMTSGVEAIDSAQQNSNVRVFEDEGKVKKRGRFAVSVFNASNVPINFGTENISIVFGDGEPVPVVTYERLLKEEKNRQMWAAIAVGLSAAGNSLAASQAGYSSGTATYSGTTYGSYGSYNSFGSVSYSGYNGSAAYAAQANANMQNQALFDRLAASNAANLQALKDNLRTTTVDPGNGFGGMVTFELPKAARKLKAPVVVRIIVDLGNDRHEFQGHLVQR